MTYFFDTCALLHNFKKDLPKGFYISSITLKELENMKTSCHKDEEVKYQARQLRHKLEKADYNVELYNSYLDEYLKEGLPVDELSNSFKKLFYKQKIHSIIDKSPILNSFNSTEEDKITNLFRR